jgi:hypothetical protein
VQALDVNAARLRLRDDDDTVDDPFYLSSVEYGSYVRLSKMKDDNAYVCAVGIFGAVPLLTSHPGPTASGENASRSISEEECSRRPQEACYSEEDLGRPCRGRDGRRDGWIGHTSRW